MGLKFSKFSKSKKTGMTLVSAGILFAFVAGGTAYCTINKFTAKVPMYVASNSITKGDPLGNLNGKPAADKKGNAILKVVKVAKGGVPSDAIPVDTDFSTLITTKDMSKGDILRKSNVIDLKHDNPSLFSARLKALDNPDLVAGEVPIDSMDGMLDGIKAGDKVYLVGVSKEKASAASSNNPAQTAQTAQTAPSNNEVTTQGKELVKDAIIIGVKSDTSNGGKLALVVAVGKDDAVKIATAKEQGKVYAFLLPFGTDNKTSAK